MFSRKWPRPFACRAHNDNAMLDTPEELPMAYPPSKKSAPKQRRQNPGPSSALLSQRNAG